MELNTNGIIMYSNGTFIIYPRRFFSRLVQSMGLLFLRASLGLVFSLANLPLALLSICFVSTVSLFLSRYIHAELSFQRFSEEIPITIILMFLVVSVNISGVPVGA